MINILIHLRVKMWWGCNIFLVYLGCLEWCTFFLEWKTVHRSMVILSVMLCFYPAWVYPYIRRRHIWIPRGRGIVTTEWRECKCSI